MPQFAIRVTRRDGDGSGYAERLGDGFSYGNEVIFYPEAEIPEIQRKLKACEPGIIIELEEKPE